MSENLLTIKVYQGFASERVVCIFGHVFKSTSKQRERLTKNPFKNALEMYRRYNVSPAKNEAVKLQLSNGAEYEEFTDGKGFFRFQITAQIKEQEVSYLISLVKTDYSLAGKVLKTNPELIIVSDIDDTILISHSTNLIKKLYLLLTKNHESRKAFKGIRDRYKQLSARDNTAFFYVSSSEWNLYDFLNGFVEHNDLPKGVFLLQDIKSGIMDLFKSGGGSHSHKKDKIRLIMESYPNSEFILVGDSGQKDPKLYKEIALKKGSRIRSIHIRDVRSSKRRKVEQIVSELAESNITMEVFS